jgi:HSP20 family protein
MINVSFQSGPESKNGPLNEKRRTVVETVGWQIRVHPHAWSPPTDVFETETSFVVRVEIAGMRDQDFSVTLDNNYLTISGVRPDVPERRAYHQMEIRSGEFNAVVSLPGDVDIDQSTAEYEDGFLTITLPKAITTPDTTRD